MDFNDIRNARIAAQHQVELADQAVKDAVRLASGRLKAANVPTYLLEELKRELKDFNAKTGEWK